MRQAYLGTILAVILLASAVSASYAAGPAVQVFAKEKQGLILLLIKNEQDLSIHGMKLEVLGGEITSVKVPRGWAVETGASDTTSISVSTTGAPIKAGERAVFFLGASEVNTIISWAVTDRFGSTIGIDDSRTAVRQMMGYRSQPAAGQEDLLQIRPLIVTTDKIFYDKNDKMIISGKMEPNADLTITIYTPSGDKIKITDETDAKGSFNILHLLQDAGSGTYHLKVRQSDASAETIFRVL